MDESKRVGRSLVVLLAALLLVYVVFFDVHGDKLRISSLTSLEDSQNTNSGNISGADIDRMLYIDTTNQVSNNAESDDVYYPSYYQDAPGLTQTNPDSTLLQAQNIDKEPVKIAVAQPTTVAQETGIPNIVEDVQGRRFYSTDFLFGQSNTDPNDTINVGTTANPVGVNAGISNTTVVQNPVVELAVATTVTGGTPATLGGVTFANTHVWDGMITILQSLELDDDVQYIQKDVNNTHYVYLGKWQGSINQIVSDLGGSSIDINDQVVIQNNQLFGQSVTRITMPSYKRNLKELMLVKFANGDVRFFQIDKDWYNQLQNKLAMKQTIEAEY